MPKRIFSIVFFCIFATATTPAQKPDGDSQTLRQILAELRAIHEDMRVTETTQLLVAELEMQQGVVNRAVESADNARSKLDGIHIDQKRLAGELERGEDQMDKASNSDERNAIAQENDRRKANLEALKAIEHQANTDLQDMEQRLQNAQDKLASIEAELNAAIARLGPAENGSSQK